MYACIHQTSMHIFIHTYEHTRTHTKEGVRVVSDYQHMYFILQGRINKNRYFIFTGSYFFCRGCCQVRSGHHYVEMSSLQQTNVWWETPPRGATVWVVSHNTWHLTPISTVPTNNTRPQVAQSNSQKDSVSADSRMTGRNCERMRVWTSGCTIFVVLLLSLAVYLRLFAFIWNDNSWWPASLQSVVYAWGNMVQTKIICQTEEFEEHCGKYLDIFCSM